MPFKRSPYCEISSTILHINHVCSKKICTTDFTVGFFEHLEKKIQATQLWRTATTKPQHEFSFKDFIPRSPLNNNRKRIRTNRFLNRELFAWLHCILIVFFLFCTMGQIKEKYICSFAEINSDLLENFSLMIMSLGFFWILEIFSNS